MLGEQQGTLFSLLGSGSPLLCSGNEALEELIDRYGGHPLAVYARMVKGLSAERGFKELTPGGRIRVRPPDLKQGIAQLSTVTRAASADGLIDNITLNMVMRRLARAEARQGDLGRAEAVLDRMVAMFARRGVNPLVLGQIRRQAEQAKAELRAGT
jgi:hypothetical protein